MSSYENYFFGKKNKLKVGIEINLSCPNIIGKGQLAYDFNNMKEYLDELFLKISFKYISIIGIKLPPYFELHHFKIVANIIKQFPFNFITTINSIPNGLVIDHEKECAVITPKQGLGGLGGSIVKPTALANVFNFAKEFENTHISVIGCGGIESGIDVFEYILCGASAVQIGTQYYKEGVCVFKRLNHELEELMETKKYTKISDFKGKILYNEVFEN